MSDVTIRELGGEIWAELFALRRVHKGKFNELNVEISNSLIDLVMGVLARHEGEYIRNDADLPVIPLPR
jgi:hypothetical protein